MCALLQAHESVLLTAMLQEDEPAQLIVWDVSRIPSLGSVSGLWVANAVDMFEARKAIATYVDVGYMVDLSF